MDRLLNIEEVAIQIGLSKSTLYVYTCKKQIPYIKLGRRVMFDPKRIDRWIRERMIEEIKVAKEDM